MKEYFGVPIWNTENIDVSVNCLKNFGCSVAEVDGRN